MANILVVDDDDVTLKVVGAALKKAGHTVTTAKDGHSAIEICNKEIFEMIISDANMPGGISGFNLVSTLRKMPHFMETPIMFLTGRREKDDVMRAVDSGADDYVVKPIDPDIFTAKIESLLKTKGAKGFNKTPVTKSGSWNLALEIVGVSEQGISFLAPAQLAVNSKLKIETELYAEIGLVSPQLRIQSCIAADNSEKKFLCDAAFIGLNENDFKMIRRFCMSNSPLKSKKTG